MMKIGQSVGDEIAKKVNQEISKSTKSLDTARTKFEKRNFRNVFYSAGLTLLLLLFSLFGIWTIKQNRDATKLAETKVEKMLENEKENIKKQAVDDYKNSNAFVTDGATYVANNFFQLRILEVFYQEMPIKDKKNLGLYDWLNEAHKKYKENQNK